MNNKDVMLKYEFAMKVIKNKLECLVSEYEAKNNYNIVEHVKCRVKTIESASNKLVRKGYEVNSDNLKLYVHDMIGIRMVCSFLSDVYELVGLIKNSDDFRIVDESDYIKNPKSSGYISYHLNVMVPIKFEDGVREVEAEVQIRTVAMDFFATSDHKLRYKMPIDVPKNIEDEMLNCSNDIIMLDQKMQKLYNTIKTYQG